MKNFYTSSLRQNAFCLYLLTFGCFLLSSFLSVPVAQAQLSGTYTIGGEDGDFASFSQAVQALGPEGNSEPVTFKVRPGIYREQLHLNHAYENLTFEGESNDSTEVVLENESGHAILIEGGRNYAFRDMTISGSGSAVHILRGVEYGTSDILLESNILKGGPEHAVIETYSDGRGFPHHNHTYRNNLIIGEGTGISKNRDTHVDWFLGGRLTDDGLEISGNIIQAKGTGIQLYAQEQIKVNDNIITVGERDEFRLTKGIDLSYIYRFSELNQNELRVSGPVAEGLRVWGAHSPEEMLQNRVLLSDGGTGIIFGPNLDDWVRPSLVANNMVSVKGNRGSTGLVIDNSRGTPAFYHNSVLVYGEDAESKALSLRQGHTVFKAELLNNTFANKAGGYAVQVEVENSEEHGIIPVSHSDYNVFYSNGNHLAFLEAQNLTDISQWQSLTGFDAHSLSVDPMFASDQNLIPANPALASAGIWFDEVKTDFFGNLRHDPPSIGAVEMEGPTEGTMAGTYTIGGEDGDFASFDEAIAMLESEGISDSVIFKVRPGTYEEQLLINSIPGSSCSRPVVFAGEGAAPAEVSLRTPQGSAYTIQVNGVDGIGFHNLNIVNGIKVNPGTDCFSLEENTLSGSAILVQARSSAQMRNHHHRYLNNLFIGGATALQLTTESDWDPSAPVFDEGLRVEGNEFREQRQSAVVLSGQRGFRINQNKIAYQGSVKSVGISITNSWYGEEMKGNIINIFGGGTGINTSSGAPARVTENRIRMKDGGLAMHISPGRTAGNEVLIANNQLVVDGYERSDQGLAAMAGLSVAGGNNNIIKIYHNSVMVSGYKSLQPNYAFQAEGEANSLHILNNSLVNMASGFVNIISTPAAIAVMDYNNLYNPWFSWGDSPVIKSLAEWQSLTGFDSHSISVAPHHDEGINEAWKGAGIFVEEVPTDMFGRPRGNPPSIGAIELEGTPYKLSGTYTIGGEDGDFASFTDAVAAMDQFGVQDSIKFLVRPGVYPEQLYLTTTYASFPSGRVTFEGETGDSTDVVLGVPDLAAVEIVSAGQFAFRYMSLAGLVSAKAIASETGIQDLSFEHNILKGVNIYTEGRTSGSSGHLFRNNYFENWGIEITRDSHIDPRSGASTLDGGPTIIGNVFRSGGINLYAQSGGVVNHNTITDGINMAFSDLSEINHNTIVGGISHYGDVLPGQILNNRILLPNGGVGISLWWGLSTTLVANNMIAVKGNNRSVGIQISVNQGLMRLYNNSVLIYGEDPKSIALDIPWNGPVNDIELRNNIFTNKAGGYIVYVEDAPANTAENIGISSADYNAFFTNGEVFAHWKEEDIHSFSEWQSLTDFDAHSLSVDPQFDSAEILIPANTALAGAGVALEEVPRDFFGSLRKDPPTIGAVEMKAEPLPLIPFVECVVRNRDGSYTATFGYENPNPQALNMAVGPDNHLDLLEYAGQPDRFVPGRHERVFHVVFEGSSTLSWTLGSETVYADRNTGSCESPIQAVVPLVTCVSEISRAIYMAKMGYHNPNQEPVAIATGRLNRMPGQQQQQGQPAVFEPGHHGEAFYATYTGILLWTLGSERVMATRRTQSCSPGLQAVEPVLECVSRNQDGSYTAHFGYDNPNPFAVSVGFKLHNFVIFAGRSGDEVPVIFEPGRHAYVFSIPFRGQRLEWRLMGTSVRATPAAAGGCEAVDTQTASKEFSKKEGSQVPVYPNPFTQMLNVHLSTVQDGPVKLKIYSLSGMLLKNIILQQRGLQQLDLETMGAGTYILEIQAAGIQERVRIVKH